MERNFRTQVRNYLSSRKKRKIGHKVMFCLASVVVFSTVYALILPAITLSNELLCGKEAHVHTEACWSMAEALPQPELVCDYMRTSVVIIHSHNQYCCDNNGKLICRLPEVEAHVHTADCYMEHRTLICGESQDLGHEHTSSCYTYVRGDLLCGEGEGGSSHTHTDDCYTVHENRVLSCEVPEEPGHVHDESCYEETEREVLTCGQTESEDVVDEETGEVLEYGHTHDSSCYETETERRLACEKTEDGGHTHTDSCYEIETVRELTCGKTEGEGHTHNDECYEWEQALSCHEEEHAGGHIHTDECYEVEEILICSKEETIPHTHTVEECYVLVEKENENEEDEYVLVCEKPEVLSHVHTSSCVYVPETTVEETVPTLICGKEEHEHTEACYMEVYPEDTVQYYCGLAEHWHTEECYFESGELRCTLTEHQHNELCTMKELWQDNDEVEEIEGITLDNDFQCQTEDGYFLVSFHIKGYAPLLPGGETAVPPEEGEDFGSLPGETNAPEEMGEPEEAEDGSGFVPPSQAPAAAPVEKPSASRPAAAKPPASAGPNPTVQPERTPETPTPSEPEQELDPVQPEEPTISAIEPDTEPVKQEEPVVEPITPEPSEPVLSREEQILNSGLAPYSLRMDAQKRVRQLLPDDDGLLEAETGFDLSEVQITLIEEEPDLASETDETEENAEAELIPERKLSFTASLNGQELDLSACEVTVKVSLSEELLSALITRESAIQTLENTDGAQQDAADEDEAAVEQILRVRAKTPDGQTTYETETVVDEANPASEEIPVESEGSVSVTLLDSVYPSYSVEYYAYIKRPVEVAAGTGSSLPFIDTTGKNLPQNTNVQTTKYMSIEAAGSGFKIAFEEKLTQLYSTAEKQIFVPNANLKASDLDAVNRSENGIPNTNQMKHYNVYELWVREPDAVDCSDESPEWTRYTTDENKRNTPGYVYVADLDTLAFTNTDPRNDTSLENPETTITIKKGSVLRMVYRPIAAENVHENDVAFYDYNISDGYIYKSATINAANQAQNGTQTSDQKVYLNTNQQGINNSSNYADNKNAKFAFGNSNTDMGLGDETWSGNKLNMTNKAVTGSEDGSGKGCTFGLVERYNGIDPATGNVKFVGSVNAPENLFGSGSAIGKTAYEGDLYFRREGDTYTLVSAENYAGTLSNLDTFSHPTSEAGKEYTTIWTNNFWPMDNGNEAGKDALSGRGTNVYHVGASGNAAGYPPSDDGQMHNNYFGMRFAVQFRVPKDYIGPLEYFFYGDDDMWVYLVDSAGNSQLVCDIGGVHSSVGEYVNLWDYIGQDSSNRETKDYQLVFFYTERGASGSTCWMQYTLPNIANVPVNITVPNDQTLKVEKLVESSQEADLEREYSFTITLKGSGGMTYQGSIFDANDNEIEGKEFLVSGNGEADFQLKTGQYMKLLNFPGDIGYEIRENTEGLANCHVSILVKDSLGNKVIEGDTLKDIGTDKVVTFTNAFYFELPSTGGRGIPWHTLGGGLLLVAGCLWYRKKPVREGAAD